MPGCRSASCRRVPGWRRGSPPGDRAGRGGTRRTARWVRRLPRVPAYRCARPARRTANPVAAQGRRGTARRRGWTPRCPAARGCRRSRTGGSRPGRGWPASGCPAPVPATPPRTAPPVPRPATPGCFPRPGSRRCTAAAGRGTPAGGCGPDPRRPGPATDPATGRDRRPADSYSRLRGSVAGRPSGQGRSARVSLIPVAPGMPARSRPRGAATDTIRHARPVIYPQGRLPRGGDLFDDCPTPTP